MAGADDRTRLVLRFAEQVEDAAGGLHKFKEDLPRQATKITAYVSELFAISSALRSICSEDNARQYGPSYYRIDKDLALLFRSLQATLNDIFGMFARSHDRPSHMIWEDLQHRFDEEEGFKLQERLEWYRDFLKYQIKVLEGRRPSKLKDLKEDLIELSRAQQNAPHGAEPTPKSGANTTRPRPPVRPPYLRMDTPSTTTVLSDDWDEWEDLDRPPVAVPEPPPLHMPTSPTCTSGSSESMFSSLTSYSSDGMYPLRPPERLRHWAQKVYDGSSPLTSYKAGFQSEDQSACYGPHDPAALQNLGRDGFQRAMQIAFDEDRLWVRLCWRPSDHRARILIVTKDRSGHQLLSCTPLTNLKIIRNGSCLQLCRARRGDGGYALWARLTFLFHERMVLFYATFVAMKRQDERGVDSQYLGDDFELENDEAGEKCLFAGQIQHGGMLHALRLFRDRGSGVVRLEASPLRGPRKDVPIWTAFVTKYKHDPDHCEYARGRPVTIAAIKPPPSVFIARYQPPQNRLGYVLPFTSDEDSRMFIETWAGLSRLR
ncbi:hypothetical protein DOTSEDRAFT_73904 [Dothistroma septosporum NZE10]|uniref:Uncharacterized protein n=1 Tax=Dothistroma septosporum (strain NZE10 / CBS 128990) TaxID=675120 RepID=N1PJE1_DOTSN|nr:hypothetical protein DOTSEDRAFT_73904 [Dothistroma septosporum NZE10]